MLSPEDPVSSSAESSSHRPAGDAQRFVFDYRLLNQGGGGSLWSNLGLWQGDETYAQACSALARRIGDCAGLSSATSVLDVGCGAGDQILLWCNDFGVSHALGCELDPALVTTANQRLVAHPEVRVERASATDLAHLPSQSFDRVVALDCAYHFDTRDQFFAQAYRLLRPGGRLVFTDIALGWSLDHTVGRSALGGLAAACQIPRGNLMGPAQLRHRLRHAGLVPSEVTFLDRPVLRGFARFTHRQRRRWRGSAQGRKVRATGWLCGLSYWTRNLHYLLIRADKPALDEGG